LFTPPTRQSCLVRVGGVNKLGPMGIHGGMPG